MIHTANLITKREEYVSYDIRKRAEIFNALYQFARKIPAKYHSIIIDKKYHNTKNQLRKHLYREMEELIYKNKSYFSKFDKVVIYYDNGQKTVGIILDETLGKLNGYIHKIDFNHTEKKLFQVADMLTYLDKFEYKNNKKIPLVTHEKYFHNYINFKKIIQTLNKKRF